MAETNNKMKIGIVGTGNIAGPYVKDLKTSPQIDIGGVADAFPEKAQAFGEEYDLKVYDSLDALLADDSIELVANLTIHHAHFDITTRCLNAGKHVYSEKPLALTYQEAKALVELAERNGVRLGASPFTFMGKAQQAAWRRVEAGELGTVRLAYAEVNWGRIESWHPNPAPFYEVGPLWDVGVYPLTFLTAVFGPVRKVTAYGKTLKADRTTLDGDPFELNGPDFLVCLLEHTSGVLTRLTANFYVTQKSKQESAIEIHGDNKSLYLSSWFLPNGKVEVAEFNKPYEPLPNVDAPNEMPWGTGIRDMVDGLLGNRPHRATGAQAAHIVEVLEAAYTSVSTGDAVEVRSDFVTPEVVGRKQ